MSEQEQLVSEADSAQTPEKPVIPEVTGPVDLVVLISRETADKDYNELRFVLRSFRANFAALGRIVIVGVNPPRWLKPGSFVYVAVPDRIGPWGVKAYNIMNKLKIACERGLSRHFIFGSDDQFLLRPSVPADFWPREEGHVVNWSQKQWDRQLIRRRKGGPSETTRIFYGYLKHTAEALKARGKDVYNFDSHHPVLMDSQLFPQVVTEYGFHIPTSREEPLFLINSLYFNAVGAKPLHVKDSHRIAGTMPPPDARFWNVNQHRYWARAMPFLEERFPEPSPFERPAPPVVREDYRASPSATSEFIAEKCVVDPNLSVPCGVLLDVFNAWSSGRGLPPTVSMVFAERLQGQGFKKEKSGEVCWHGLGLRDASSHVDAEPAEGPSAIAG